MEEGDLISIDIPNCTIELEVSDEELAERQAAWVCPEPRVKTGYLARYAKLVTSADKGAKSWTSKHGISEERADGGLDLLRLHYI